MFAIIFDTAYTGVISALADILTTDAMLANLAALLPVVGGVLLFAFTFRLIRRLISGAQKGKAKI